MTSKHATRGRKREPRGVPVVGTRMLVAQGGDEWVGDEGREVSNSLDTGLPSPGTPLGAWGLGVWSTPLQPLAVEHVHPRVRNALALRTLATPRMGCV